MGVDSVYFLFKKVRVGGSRKVVCWNTSCVLQMVEEVEKERYVRKYSDVEGSLGYPTLCSDSTIINPFKNNFILHTFAEKMSIHNVLVFLEKKFQSASL